MDKAQLLATIKQICNEKNIPLEAVHATIEAALAAAYRKDFGSKGQNIVVQFNLETGESKIFEVKTVVEDFSEEELQEGKTLMVTSEEGEEKEIIVRFNDKADIMLKDAKKINKKYKVGEEIWTELETPSGYGRVAAQTAKQVIIQKLREAERSVLFDEFKGREGELVIGTVQRREPSRVLIDLGTITAVMPQEEQVMGERYRSGERIKVIIKAVNQTTKGPEIVVSRAAEQLVAKLFAMEIPEIASGTVVVKALAREAGSRTKIAVYTSNDNIDAIGSCVGQKGARIQTIIAELSGEKIDIILWDENPEMYIKNALSPAKVTQIEIDEATKTAKILVAADQLSLAIGKAGQNVRLAVKLTGWNINIKERLAPAKNEEVVLDADKSQEPETEPETTEVETEK